MRTPSNLTARSRRLIELLGPPRSQKKTAFEFSPRDWNELYKNGRHKTMWELEGPSAGAVVLAALLPPGPGARLLDIGCGAGADSIHFARRGYAVTAVDIGAAALQRAQANAEAAGVATIQWIEGDIRRLELARGDFDLAHDRGCLHCLPLNDWPAYGNSLYSLLKPKAPLFVFGCGVAESAFFAPLTGQTLAQLKPWFSIEVFDEVQHCSATGHLRGGFGLLRRRA